MNRTPLVPAAVAAAAVSAAAVLLRRMLRHGAVEQAVRDLPVTAVPRDTVAATASVPANGLPGAGDGRADGPAPVPEHATGGQEGPEERPTRTWVVNNSSDWDGNPLELVVPPGDPRRQGHPIQGRDNPGTPAV